MPDLTYTIYIIEIESVWLRDHLQNAATFKTKMYIAAVGGLGFLVYVKVNGR